jgi:hypothetical protein
VRACVFAARGEEGGGGGYEINLVVDERWIQGSAKSQSQRLEQTYHGREKQSQVISKRIRAHGMTFGRFWLLVVGGGSLLRLERFGV